MHIVINLFFYFPKF